MKTFIRDVESNEPFTDVHERLTHTLHTHTGARTLPHTQSIHSSSAVSVRRGRSELHASSAAVWRHTAVNTFHTHCILHSGRSGVRGGTFTSMGAAIAAPQGHMGHRAPLRILTYAEEEHWWRRWCPGDQQHLSSSSSSKQRGGLCCPPTPDPTGISSANYAHAWRGRSS